MSSDIPSVHRARVNGAFLQQFHAKPVCMLGQVIKAEGGGSAFQIRASDGAQINIRLKQPISESLSGLIEVYGTGQGKNLILAESFTSFPASDNFDMGTYNELVVLMNTIEGNNPYKINDH